MLRQNNEQTSGILSSRLSGKKGKSDVIDISALRHNKADDNTVIPTYGPSQPEVAESSSQKPKKQKMEKSQQTMKKRRPRRRKDASSGNTQSEPLESANDLDELIDAESFRAARRQEHFKMVKGRFTRTAMILIILLCLYIAFLIFGLMQTSYIYNEDGKVVPEILSVEDLRTLNQYDTLSNYYLRVCILYEHMLDVDFALSKSADNTTLHALEYTQLLDEVSKLSTDISAAQLDTAYTPILSQMYTLVNTHIAVYLQNMSNALTTNSEEAASQALQGRTVIESEFTSLTSNLAMLCNATNGAKNGDIYSWSPTKYMNSLAEGGAS